MGNTYIVGTRVNLSLSLSFNSYLCIRGTTQEVIMTSAIIDVTNVEGFTLVHTVTPRAKNVEIFNRSVIPTKEMKAYRDTLTTVCSFCHESQKEKLVCAKVRLGMQIVRGRGN